jgi:hypothetical protein
LRGDHGFQVAPFGTGLRLPVGFQFVPELGVFCGVFVGEDRGAGAQAVGECVEADGRFPFRGVRTGRVLGILAGWLLVVSLKSAYIYLPIHW